MQWDASEPQYPNWEQHAPGGHCVPETAPHALSTETGSPDRVAAVDPVVAETTEGVTQLRDPNLMDMAEAGVPGATLVSVMLTTPDNPKERVRGETALTTGVIAEL